MGLTISLNRVSFLLPPVRYNIFNEIETSSTDYTTPDWVHSLSRTNSLQEGAGSRFGEKSLKKRENLGLGPPLFAPCFEKVWIRPRSTLKKNMGPYIRVYNIV